MRYVLAIIVFLVVAGFASADVFNMGSGFTNLEMVTVGNPGNAADTEVMVTDHTTGYGSVNYIYNIGKFEVTAGQYTEFLNAKAKTDTYGLFNPSMWSDAKYGCKIWRSGISGSYTYGVAAGYENRPVGYVSFWDAARFANWLSNGQGNGDTETGAYTLNGYNGSDGREVVRNADAKWWIPSEDEWYKAAYHDKSAGLGATYFDFPTSSNSVPGIDMNDVLGNNANYHVVFNEEPIDSGKYMTIVGEFQNSASPYGTFDQGGNIGEWNESILRGSIGGRGGTFVDTYPGLASYYRFYFGSSNVEFGPLGFRVASVPEPSTLAMLLSIAVGGFLWWKRRNA
ncbi:MAG: SUMF1/EgtB/PvdO family nonheme iron enzyme [Pirellulales bacterium]|nr:SUMF1/EgtB/PvdO family nonheme iron enzyme [Pirellulales bacterium]